MSKELLAAILDRSADAASVAWAHQGVGNLAALPNPEVAIEAALSLGNVAALTGVQQPKALRKLAAAALHKLKSKGVKVEAKLPPKSFTLSAESVNIAPRAFLSVPNALGNHHLVLTSTDRTGSCIMEFVIGGDKFEDHHGHASRSELRQFWKELEGDTAMREVPFATGLRLGLDAIGEKRSHGWEHLLEKVDAATLSAAKQNATLDAGVRELEDVVQWLLPAWLVPAGVVAHALATQPDQMNENGAPSAAFVEWIESTTAAALAEAGPALAAAARVNQRIFEVLGRESSAARMIALANAIDQGLADGTTEEVKQAVLTAISLELQHRQAEQEADVQAMMKMIGSQRGGSSYDDDFSDDRPGMPQGLIDALGGEAFDEEFDEDGDEAGVGGGEGSGESAAGSDEAR